MGSASVVKLLLDTHIWLWSRGQPDKLAPRVARELTSGDNELWLSPISPAHHDPTDRFLAATARVFDLTLVTADQRLIGAPGLSILANR